MHAFWKESDPRVKQMEMVQFDTDLALGGAVLVMLGGAVALQPAR